MQKFKTSIVEYIYQSKLYNWKAISIVKEMEKYFENKKKNSEKAFTWVNSPPPTAFYRNS